MGQAVNTTTRASTLTTCPPLQGAAQHGPAALAREVVVVGLPR
jgi:hypothetical protein